MAFQIYEENFQEDTIVFGGIDGSGYRLAQLLLDEFTQISPISGVLCKITVDKLHPVQSEVILDISSEQIGNKAIILIDDVLNTGRTLAYSLRPFLKLPIKKLQTAVLVDRNHKSFPISADYVGYALSTTLQAHITVLLEADTEFGVYLS